MTRMTKAERAELETLRMWRNVLGWAAVCTLLLSAVVQGYLNYQPVQQTVPAWDTQVIPNPNYQYDNKTEFKWPLTPLIDAALKTLNPVTPALAALHPVAEEPQIKSYPWEAPKLKLWTVTQFATDTKHEGCVAERWLTQTTRIAVYADRKGLKALIVDGVTFELSEEQSYTDAIISVDGAVIMTTSAQRQTQYRTQVNFNELDLQKFAKAKIMRVTINNKYFEFDLTDSKRAVETVADCNSRGQSRTVQRRVDAATPALTR